MYVINRFRICVFLMLPLIPSLSCMAAQQVNHAAIERAPYLQLLLEPARYLNDERYLQAEDVDKADLINFAKRVLRADQYTIDFLYKTLVAISQNSNANVQTTLDLMKTGPSLAPNSIRHTLSLAKKYLKSGTIQDAIRWLSADALKARLHRLPDGTILDVYFTPLDKRHEHTRLEETLIWLIRSEQQSIRVASYFFTNQVVAYNLREAIDRGVKVEVIADKNNFKTSGSSVLDELDLPFKIWQQPGARNANVKMHQKFMLFEKNIDDQSIVAMGSYNITEMANRQHENMLITNNPYIFDRFSRRFTFIEYFAQEPIYDDSNSYSSDSDDEVDILTSGLRRRVAAPENKAAQLLLKSIEVQVMSLAYVQDANSRKRQRDASYVPGALRPAFSSSSAASSSSSGRR